MRKVLCEDSSMSIYLKEYLGREEAKNKEKMLQDTGTLEKQSKITLSYQVKPILLMKKYRR